MLVETGRQGVEKLLFDLRFFSACRLFGLGQLLKDFGGVPQKDFDDCKGGLKIGVLANKYWRNSAAVYYAQGGKYHCRAVGYQSEAADGSDNIKPEQGGILALNVIEIGIELVLLRL